MGLVFNFQRVRFFSNFSIFFKKNFHFFKRFFSKKSFFFNSFFRKKFFFSLRSDKVKLVFISVLDRGLVWARTWFT